jgi:hypothetical protein
MAEVGFLFSGIWMTVVEVGPPMLVRFRRVVASVALALAGALLIVAVHWATSASEQPIVAATQSNALHVESGSEVGTSSGSNADSSEDLSVNASLGSTEVESSPQPTSTFSSEPT